MSQTKTANGEKRVSALKEGLQGKQMSKQPLIKTVIRQRLSSSHLFLKTVIQLRNKEVYENQRRFPFMKIRAEVFFRK